MGKLTTMMNVLPKREGVVPRSVKGKAAVTPKQTKATKSKPKASGANAGKQSSYSKAKARMK